jgi:hypothetical protein
VSVIGRSKAWLGAGDYVLVSVPIGVLVLALVRELTLPLLLAVSSLSHRASSQ